jgi:hypothetical protein
MKAKIIKKPNINEILNLSSIFRLESPININEYKNIIEFFDDNDNLIGFVNYVENHYLDYTKSFINMIYFTEDTYLDMMIKLMIKQLKQKKYSYALLNSESDLFDKNTIKILKLNNFAGDDFLFLNL